MKDVKRQRLIKEVKDNLQGFGEHEAMLLTDFASMFGHVQRVGHNLFILKESHDAKVHGKWSDYALQVVSPYITDAREISYYINCAGYNKKNPKDASAIRKFRQEHCPERYSAKTVWQAYLAHLRAENKANEADGGDDTKDGPVTATTTADSLLKRFKSLSEAVDRLDANYIQTAEMIEVVRMIEAKLKAHRGSR